VVEFEDDVILQEVEESLRQEQQTIGICGACRSIRKLNSACLTCAMVGVGMRHSTPLTSLLEYEHEVNMVEDSKPTASEWLVDSGSSVHMTNCKEDLNDPETTSQAINHWEWQSHGSPIQREEGHIPDR